MVVLKPLVRLCVVGIVTCIISPRAQPTGLFVVPVITTCNLTCNANGTLTASITATDADGNLQKIEGFLRRYDNEDDCAQNQNYTLLTPPVIEKASAGAATLSDTQTVNCTVGKFYRLACIAEDPTDVIGSLTECCECKLIQGVPALPAWALAVLTVSAVAVGGLLLRRPQA